MDRDIVIEQNDSLGYWIRRRRKALDLTQHELAQQVGCAVSTVRKWEADVRQPARATAERLADTLGLSGADRTVFLQVARNERRTSELTLPLQPVAPAQPTSFPSQR